MLSELNQQFAHDFVRFVHVISISFGLEPHNQEVLLLGSRRCCLVMPGNLMLLFIQPFNEKK